MQLKYTTLLISMLALFSACSEDPKKTETTAVKKPTERPAAPEAAETEPAENLQEFIANNELTENWLKALNNVNPENFNGSKKPFTNRHNPAITDTIVTLQNGPTTMEFYQTASNQMLQAARIHNRAVTLGNAVKVGMPKAQLEKILFREIPGNKIQVGDEEKFSIFRFEFAADTVKSIVFEGYVD